MQEPLQNRGRARQQNIIREAAGPTRQAFEAGCGRSSGDAFKIFINHQMVDMIVTHTNAEARRQVDDWEATDRDELYVFIGLLILAGVYRAKNEPISQLWSKTDGRSIFGKSMSRDRFQKLQSYLRFDDRTTRIERRADDKLAPIRELIELFATKCRSSYKPGQNITIDEQLLSYRGRCPFKVYIPNKPGKYGIKIWIVADSQTNYCSNLQVYTGRNGPRREVGQASRVVLELTDYLTNSGRHLTGDNFFSSVPLVHALLGRNITYNGTLRQNKPDIPPQMLARPEREVESSLFGFQEHLTMVSYVPKRNKSVILLSSQHKDNERQPEPPHKPEMILHYNVNKAGVDTLDQLVRTYSTKRKCRRWPVTLFENIIDIAAYNAFVLFISVHPQFGNNSPHRRRKFLLQLAKGLLPEEAHEGPQDNAQPPPPPAGAQRTRRRCHSCPYRRHRKSKLVCSQCDNPVCGEHSYLICNNCAQ